ncbi:MAG: nucleotidyl transferase AbiEii/AbiGii toxin family protein [Kiritimatiellae bacterium]|nr:nucleotidyl transferase AbiEii/AbiGii toxin family protein [Kiritimatiellia bacterium]
MNDAIREMLARYACRTRDDYIHALREILQELALLGLWRSKFFEHAAFYGGTALRVLYGLDRYSEDLDFSLLKPDPGFSLAGYGEALRREMMSFGFDVAFEHRKRTTAIESAFLKTNTVRQLVVVEAEPDLLEGAHARQVLKIKLEVDTDPPGGFETESRYVLQPVPFAVRAYSLPDLLAGKMHAVLFRKWKTRVKGRDWYDLVWYAARHPSLHLRHLESRMRQSGDFEGPQPLDRDGLMKRLQDAVEQLDVEKARREVEPFLRNPESLTLWSKPFFRQVIERIETV